MPNHYQILGIPETASADEIKSAFKKKAILYHPDKHAGDSTMEELFKEVNTAYQILSNPYSKSNYDLTLTFGAFQTSPPPPAPNSYSPPPPPAHHSPHGYQRRPPFRPQRQRMNSKENMKATFYAFSIAFVLGVIVYSGIWTLKHVRAEEKAAVLAERRLVFESAVSNYGKGNVAESLEILDSFKYYDQSEVDIRDYREKILQTTMVKGDRNLKNKNYAVALEAYNILEPYSISNSLNFKMKKAKAYRGIGDFQKTIEIYEQIYQDGYRTTSFYYEIGLTYEQGDGNYEQAQYFYKRAAESAASEYESTLGKAYPIMITAEHIPEIHYDIYMKLANTYYETKDYEEGINSLRWAKEMWPDSALNYYISAKCHQALNEVSLACADYNMAKFKKYNLEIPSLCN